MKQQYGYTINPCSKKPATFVTKKSLRVPGFGTKKIAEGLTLRELKVESLKSKKSIVGSRGNIDGFGDT